MSQGDQTLSDRDQTLSETDQTLSDRDQAMSDRAQQASDDDQSAADSEGDHDVDSIVLARAAAVREDTARERVEVGKARDETGASRDSSAEKRDELAAQRDQAARLADQRALEIDLREAIIDSRTGRVQEFRARAAERRKRAARDRARAARDREFAADDREQSRRDRERAGTDELTGARRRGVGLEELRREIERARRTGNHLVAAYVDVDGLKAVNDEHGHQAGDDLLRGVVRTLQRHMRSYDLIVRLGGDEFLCALPETTVDEGRRRLEGLDSELTSGPKVRSVSIGLSELRDGDGPRELIERADRDLLTRRAR